MLPLVPGYQNNWYVDFFSFEMSFEQIMSGLLVWVKKKKPKQPTKTTWDVIVDSWVIYYEESYSLG